MVSRAALTACAPKHILMASGTSTSRLGPSAHPLPNGKRRRHAVSERLRELAERARIQAQHVGRTFVFAVTNRQGGDGATAAPNREADANSPLGIDPDSLSGDEALERARELMSSLPLAIRDPVGLGSKVPVIWSTISEVPSTAALVGLSDEQRQTFNMVVRLRDRWLAENGLLSPAATNEQN